MFFEYLDVVTNPFPPSDNSPSNCDVFHIGRIYGFHVFYAPLFGKVIISDSEFRKRILSNKENFEKICAPELGPCGAPPIADKGFTHFGIFPTSECNLKCVYCYARGGESKKILNFEILKKAVEFLNENNSVEKVSVFFHGGGEPTIQFELLKKIKKYVDEELKAEKIFSLQTNGVFSNETRNWIQKNINHVTVSCDGPPYIQDFQRPLRNGGKSSVFVENTIRFFVENFIDINVETVISKFSNERQAEILEYFHKLGVNNVKFNPISERGRCLCSPTEFSTSPGMLSFFKNLLKSMELADIYDVKLAFTGSLDFCKVASCVVASRAFIITPDGFVSPCISVPSRDAEYNELIFGFFDKKENKIKINQKKLEFLQKRTVQNIPKCQNCFMKWHCAGGCAISACLMHGRDIYSPYEGYCRWIRKVGRSVLVYKIKKDLLKTHPFIEEKNGQIIYRGVFNEFELKEFPAKGKEGGSLLEVDVDKLELLTKKIEEQNPRVLLLSFKISKKYLTRETGRKIESFLKSLKEKRVSFVVAKPLPKCLFGEDYQRIIAQFKIPKGCEECIWLYILKDGSFHICGTDKTIPQSKFRSRKDIVEVFKKYNAKPTALFCEECVYKLRGNCAGLCKQMVF